MTVGHHTRGSLTIDSPKSRRCSGFTQGGHFSQWNGTPAAETIHDCSTVAVERRVRLSSRTRRSTSSLPWANQGHRSQQSGSDLRGWSTREAESHRRRLGFDRSSSTLLRSSSPMSTTPSTSANTAQSVHRGLPTRVALSHFNGDGPPPPEFRNMNAPPRHWPDDLGCPPSPRFAVAIQWGAIR